MTISPNRRSTKRGRPRVTGEQFRCSRCERMANQRRASWPGEDLCYSCFYAAMRTRGICPECGHDGVLPGLADDADREPICLSCAGIRGRLHVSDAAGPKAISTGAEPVPAAPFATI